MAQVRLTTIPGQDDGEDTCATKSGNHVSTPNVFSEQTSSIASPCERSPVDNANSEMLNENILTKMLKMAEENSNATADLPGDLHNVEDWFKSKSDSMSSLDFDTDLKNSEIDIGDLFNLKGGLHFQICETIGNGAILPSIAAGESSSQNCSSLLTQKSEGLLHVDKGIFEELLLTDSLQKLKQKSIDTPHTSRSDTDKNQYDEILLPGFQELLSNSSLADRKEILQALQIGNIQESCNLDFDGTQALSASDELDQLMGNSPTLKTIDNYRISNNTDETTIREACWIKNLLSNKIVDEVNYESINSQEVATEHFPSELLSSTVNNSSDIDCKLSSILALTAVDEAIESNSSSCTDLLDTIDKNFLKSDLGITPELPQIKFNLTSSKLSNKSLISKCYSITDNPSVSDVATAATGSLSYSNPIDNILVPPSSEIKSTNVSLEPGIYQVLSNISDPTSMSQSYQLLYDDKNIPYLTPCVLPQSSKPEVCESLHSNEQSEVISNPVTKSQSSGNPVLKIIRDQRQKLITSCINSTANIIPTNLQKFAGSPRVPLVQPSLVLGSGQAPDKQVVVPDNLLQALQDSYKILPKKIIPQKIGRKRSSPIGIKAKVVKVIKNTPNFSIPANLPKISIKKAVANEIVSAQPVFSSLNEPKVHEGKAKVVMSVNPEANQTSVHVLSSNKEQTVFKINTSDLVRAVSSIKDFHLEPLGLVQSQLVQRAVTANEYIKEIQLKSGLRTDNSSLNQSGRPSQYQNFEINQDLPEFKPPISRKLNSQVLTSTTDSCVATSPHHLVEPPLKRTLNEAPQYLAGSKRIRNMPPFVAPIIPYVPPITMVKSVPVYPRLASKESPRVLTCIPSTVLGNPINIPATSSMGNSILHLPSYNIKTSQSKPILKSVTRLSNFAPSLSNSTLFLNTSKSKYALLK